MKLKIWTGLAACMLLLPSPAGFAQTAKPVSLKNTKTQTMTWTTRSAEAKALAASGVKHFMNIEMEQAYHDLLAALKLDPGFTVALVFMTNLTRGEARKSYLNKAVKSAANKTAGEKLLSSTLDEKNTQEMNNDTWAKLHSTYPDDAMIANYYVLTRATPDERFVAAEEYIQKFPKEPAMYNIIAYYYLQDKNDNDKAKENFEKYISLYPGGYNPYDSMGEFYVTMGDVENGEKYYRLALEKYPFATSSLNALQKIMDAKPREESIPNNVNR